MDRQRWELLQSLFDKYVDLAPEERRRGLEAEQLNDASLLEEVLEMCASADLRSSEATLDLTGLLIDLLPDVQDPYLKRTLGPYRLDELIGQGGMGRVYKATRQDYGSVVAVKILYERIAIDNSLRDRTAAERFQETLDEARRQRFLQEEKTLAKLSHPSIARLMDAGAEPDGTLYFVMEYVEGKTLLQYCQLKQLSLRERLILFRIACDAVQYAHQLSVVHRDLKPSNILVTSEGQVKLLDFGISESLLEPDSQPKEAGSGYMTLAYAAPERVARMPSAVQADIYALGVVLQQLITNHFPFDFEGKETEEIRQIILHVTPRPPSTTALAGFAKNNEWGDLDAMCSKALRKDPVERYGSVEALATDIGNFLQLKPLSCRHPYTASYRSSKFARRNRRSLLLASSAVAIILAVVGFYTDRLKVTRDTALSEAEQAKDVQAFVMSLFKGFDPNMSRVSKESAEAILNQGEKEARLLKNQPLVQADVFDTLGTGFENLGDFDHAQNLFKGALRRRQEQAGNNSIATVDDLIKLGNVGGELSHLDEAESIDRRALGIVRNEKLLDPSRLGRAEIGLGNVLNHAGKYQEAVALFNDALQIAKTKEFNPEAEEDAQIGLSFADMQLGDLQKAQLHNREALRLAIRLKGEIHPDVADNLVSSHELDALAENYAEAEPKIEKAFQIYFDWLGPEHPKTIGAQRVVAQDLSSLGHPAEAERLLQEALATERHTRPEPNNETALLLNALALSETQLKKSGCC